MEVLLVLVKQAQGYDHRKRIFEERQDSKDLHRHNVAVPKLRQDVADKDRTVVCRGKG
jgi:hypothetical protein